MTDEWIKIVCCAQSCSTLCDSMDYSPPGSSVHGIFQARIREWVAISPFRRSSQPWDQIHISSVSCIGRQTLYHWATWEAVSAANKLLVYCLCPSASMCVRVCVHVCVRACVCVCMCVCVFFHGVLCFLPKFFWISWIRPWTFGKAFPVQFSQYMSGLSMERPLVDLSMSHYLHVVQHLMSRSGISVLLFPCCFFAWLSWWGV